MNDIIWEKWNCGDYVGPESMYKICGQSQRNLKEFENKLLPTYQFDLNEIIFYERKIKSINYDKSSQIQSMKERLDERGLPMSVVPLEKNYEEGNKELKEFVYRILPEFFSPIELMSVPMWLKFNFFSGKKISTEQITNCWDKFIKKINKIKFYSKKIGKDEYFNTTLNFPLDVHDLKLIQSIPYGGLIKDSLYNIPRIYQDFIENKKLPIFMELIPNSNNKPILVQKSGFNESLMNSMYFSNDFFDFVIGGRLVKHNESGNISMTTIEILEDYIFKSLKISKNNFFINTFFDKNDVDGWLNGKYKFQEKSYHIENVQVLEIKDNYYEDALVQLELWKKIYSDIIDFKFETLSLDEYKNLFDKITFSQI